MILNYLVILKKKPKPNGVVGSLIHDHEIISLLDKKTSQVVKRLLNMVIKNKIKKKKKNKKKMLCLSSCANYLGRKLEYNILHFVY